MMRPATSVLLGLALVIVGCNDTGEGETREVALVDLPCASSDGATGVWQSAPFPVSEECGSIDAGPDVCCRWVELPGNSSVRIEHPLGVAPRVVDPWISFSAHGVGSTLGSGDALRMRSADDTYVVLQNNTDQRFYLRIDLR
jgi:hypothetical protein